MELGSKEAEVAEVAEVARISAIEGSMELSDLLLRPQMLRRPVVCLRSCYSHCEQAYIEKFQYNGTSLQAIYKFDIANKVPIRGEISFVELARLCDIYEPDLRRILRFAMCYYHCFQEPRKGFVTHTATSKSIAERPGVKDALGVMFDECYQSFARVCFLMQPLFGPEAYPDQVTDCGGHGEVQKSGVERGCTYEILVLSCFWK